MNVYELCDKWLEGGKLSLDVSEGEFVRMGKQMGICGGSMQECAYDLNQFNDFTFYNGGYRGTKEFEGSWKQLYRLLKERQISEQQISFW